MESRFDVVVIGAGQAGLAMGYHLSRSDLSYVILGQEERLGDTWRKRYDSLVLFTPRYYSTLPGLSLDGDPDGYATKDEIADYLETYAEVYHLNVRLGTKVISLVNDHDGFIVKTNIETYRADQVVIATGPFQKPYIPSMSVELAPQIYQTHTAQYRNPEQLRDGSVLVVGAGNSGAQIAVELSQHRPVTLSVGHSMVFCPLELFGRSIFWWLDRVGILQAPVHSKIGSMVRKRGDPIFGTELRQLIRQGWIQVKPRATGASGHSVFFDDGTRTQADNVIWATGFQSDYDWLHIPGVLDGQGRPVHQRGVSALRGLYFLGLPWLYRRSSALIGGVGVDAEYLMDIIRFHDKI